MTSDSSRPLGALVGWRWVRCWGLCALGCAIGVTVATAADAARVRGKIANFKQLRNPVWMEARNPEQHGYSFREPVPTVPAEYRKLFPHIPKEVCIAALSTEKQKPQEPILVRVGGGRTTPVTIVVPPGQQLTFQNTDPFKHRLYGVDLKTFPPGDTAQGSTRDWTVPKTAKPKVHEIRDELAPSLRMWIVAHPRVAAIAYPSMDAEFLLRVEQPGDYKVQAYFAGKKVGKAKEVPVEGRAVDLRQAPIKVAEKKKD